MLAYASNFRENKTASNVLDKMNEDDSKKEVVEKFKKGLDVYNRVDNLKVNYNYNLNFNYAPELQSASEPNSKFYISKSSTPADQTRTKSSIRNTGNNNLTMSKSGSSFHKVTFNEQKMPHIDMSLVPNAFQAHEARKQLKSAL